MPKPEHSRSRVEESDLGSGLKLTWEAGVGSSGRTVQNLSTQRSHLFSTGEHQFTTSFKRFQSSGRTPTPDEQTTTS